MNVKYLVTLLIPALLTAPGVRADASPDKIATSLAYLQANRARLTANPATEQRLIRWAWKGLGAAMLMPFLSYAPETIVRLTWKWMRLPDAPGTHQAYLLTLLGLTGTGLAASGAVDLYHASPTLIERGRHPRAYESRRSLNRFLDLPMVDQVARLDANPRAAEWIVYLADTLRANPALGSDDAPALFANDPGADE